MSAHEVFTAMCEAIWPVEHWREAAADYLCVRTDTVDDWSSGRRGFRPSVFDELEKRARHAELVIAGARATLERYREQAS